MVTDCRLEIIVFVLQLRQEVVLMRVWGAAWRRFRRIITIWRVIQSNQTKFRLTITLKKNFPRINRFSFCFEYKDPAAFIWVVLLQMKSFVPELLSKCFHFHGRKLLHHKESILQGLNIQISLAPSWLNHRVSQLLDYTKVENYVANKILLTKVLELHY